MLKILLLLLLLKLDKQHVKSLIKINWKEKMVY